MVALWGSQPHLTPRQSFSVVTLLGAGDELWPLATKSAAPSIHKGSECPPPRSVEVEFIRGGPTNLLQ